MRKYIIGDKVKLFLSDHEHIVADVRKAWQRLPYQIATIESFTGESFARDGYYMSEIKWVWYEDEMELARPKYKPIETRFEI